MSRSQDQYLFSFTVDVSVKPGTDAADFKIETYNDVCCIIETRLGGLLLHDVRAQPIVMYAPGEWHSITTRDVTALPSAASAISSVFETPGQQG